MSQGQETPRDSRQEQKEMGTGTGLKTGSAVVLLGQGLRPQGDCSVVLGREQSCRGNATGGVDQGHQGLSVPTGPSVIQIIFSQRVHKTVL